MVNRATTVMNSSSGFVPGPAAVITGQAAYLLSRWLRTPAAIAAMRAAQWLHGTDVAEALRAIHFAGDAWQATVELRERNNEIRYELPDPDRATLTVEEASEHLGIGNRRVQQLAQSGRITSHRTGGRWVLDQKSVNTYRHSHQRKA